jgi:spore coat protein U-like protein
MVNASDATAFVPYDVYTDAAAGSQYVAGTAQSYTIPVPGQAFSLPVFGRISKTSANALPSGTYTDTLNVTLGW